MRTPEHTIKICLQLTTTLFDTPTILIDIGLIQFSMFDGKATQMQGFGLIYSAAIKFMVSLIHSRQRAFNEVSDVDCPEDIMKPSTSAWTYTFKCLCKLIWLLVDTPPGGRLEVTQATFKVQIGTHLGGGVGPMAMWGDFPGVMPPLPTVFIDLQFQLIRAAEPNHSAWIPIGIIKHGWKMMQFQDLAQTWICLGSSVPYPAGLENLPSECKVPGQG
ncbi:hypothetical protein C8R44DRAFT_754340 [Mycena epipterygia]|nr:hypothetical protein C8R44DRAFT_754340 [Mycena epipterygia]